MGIRYFSRRLGRAWAVAVLQATTMAFTPACDEETHVLVGELTDGFRAFRAVGQAGGVAEIEDVFGRQEFLHRTHDGQAADTGVEKSKRR